MTYLRLPYDEPSTPHEMAADCEVVGRTLHLPRRPAETVSGPSGTLLARPGSTVHPSPFVVTDSAAHLAGRFAD